MEVEVRHCRHAIALLEHRSFERAAVTLRITQPALSRSIRELERRVGAPLFQRSRSGAEPTDIGRVFLERARALVLQSGELQREMELLRGLETGAVRVGAGVYPAEMFVQDALVEMVRRHPRVRISVTMNVVDTLLSMLQRRELDFAVCDLRTAAMESDLRITELAWHTGYVVVRTGHPLLAVESPTMARVLEYPLVFTSRVAPDLLSILAELRGTTDDGALAIPAIGCDSLSMMRALVARTDAVTLMTMKPIAADIRSGRLATLPIREPWLGRRFAIVQLADRALAPAARALMQYIIQGDAEAAALDAQTTAVPQRAAS
jgi:DNA-binding transcriptional LysR family regulator